ncbi:DGQHR domain-containing protein DpdB [Cyanobium sp. N5-Cardenillas]|uniref:DGQHR domain-containing protein DpdB n=1 Tax=Cyanobium sp. N5-Cardenillas TaxID=2823720 RepID=UPI0020CF562F|nr:DGQHR domain-containing protein DpdB [Cyanobium sp. N5-Cardenillas]MCP9784954.1 DGQHR domain-containing protein [Cyanobium sp. N5-Cardenillas]
MASLRNRRKLLKRSAVRLDQGGVHPIYQFSLRGDELLEIADISRIDRSSSNHLSGYQRPAVRQHIREIAEYLDGADVIFPNSIIVALASSTKFKMCRGPKSNDGPGVNGTLEIELPSGNGRKPGWIVDGQQRALAIALSNKPDLPIPVNAFVTDDLEIQRDQFLRVNSAKPLPRGLVTELLPDVSTMLPQRLAARRVPSLICTMLNDEQESPFYMLIRRPSTAATSKKMALIADNSIVNMLHESIGSPTGCLFPYRNIATGETDCAAIYEVVATYWAAVKLMFPEAWGLPPTKSRLLHGVGVRAMGRLMDKIMPMIPIGRHNSIRRVQGELEAVASICKWTTGTWDDLNLEWNELQNVPRHIHALSNLLIRHYVQARMPKARPTSMC